MICKRENFFRSWLVLLILFSLGGCASLPDNTERQPSYACKDTDNTHLGQLRRDEILKHPGKSGFFLLGNGLDAFVARAVLARAAERSIDAQYYLVNDDLTARLFVGQLVEAADRGVRVRLLVDDMDLGGRTIGAAVLDSHPNIEVRLFNPFSRKSNRLVQLVTRFGSVTRRMHNKSFTVDNTVAILGGRNIGDEYFNADTEVNFTDIDVVLIGPAVQEVSASFDSYWNSELAYPATTLLGRQPSSAEYEMKRGALERFLAEQSSSPYMISLENSDLAKLIESNDVRYEWGEAHVVHDEPEKLLLERSERSFHLAPQLGPYFSETAYELYILSPYFVPGKEGTRFLKELSKRGIRVRVITNSLSSTDVPVVHSGYAKYRKDLLRADVELYEMKSDASKGGRESGPVFAESSEASLHSKAFFFDREKIFIGSLNLDPRSVHENTEIGVVLDAPVLSNRILPLIDESLEQKAFRLELIEDEHGSGRIIWHEVNDDGTGKIHRVDPDTSIWERVMVGFAGLFPIESQL